MRNCAGEIIQKTTKNDVAAWFDSFYQSDLHRVNMMSEYNSFIGAAVCQVGGEYYIVVLFGV